MSADDEDHLGIQFAHRRLGPVYTVEAFHRGGQSLGYIDWHRYEVERISVHPDYQRRGVATALWREAIRYAAEHDLPRPQHSEIQTIAGKRWARSVGD